jgi:hypothetical protein
MSPQIPLILVNATIHPAKGQSDLSTSPTFLSYIPLSTSYKYNSISTLIKFQIPSKIPKLLRNTERKVYQLTVIQSSTYYHTIIERQHVLQVRLLNMRYTLPNSDIHHRENPNSNQENRPGAAVAITSRA